MIKKPPKFKLGQLIRNICKNLLHTVDGSEIRRSPVEVGSLSDIPSFTGFYTSQVVSRISETSTVAFVNFPLHNVCQSCHFHDSSHA